MLGIVRGNGEGRRGVGCRDGHGMPLVGVAVQGLEVESVMENSEHPGEQTKAMETSTRWVKDSVILKVNWMSQRVQVYDYYGCAAECDYDDCVHSIVAQEVKVSEGKTKQKTAERVYWSWLQVTVLDALVVVWYVHLDERLGVEVVAYACRQSLPGLGVLHGWY